MASTSASPDVAKLISELRALKDTSFANETQRKELYAALRETVAAIETPLETVNRISFSSMHHAVVKVGIDVGLFTTLEKNEGKAMSTEELALATGTTPELLVRLLRYLASMHSIGEVGEEQYVASKITKSLAQPGLAAGVIHNFDSIGPLITILPKFLAECKYQGPADSTHCAFQKANNTDLPAFIWAMQFPARVQNFGLWMQFNKAGLPTWLDVVPAEELTSNSDPEKPLFIDVGGSIGHQCAALKDVYPDIKGKIIYQDLPPVLAHGLQIPGVESMAYDFWQEQPVKGAKIYYFRNIMHDYPDEGCVKILQNTAAALDKDSVIYIDEMILANFKTYYEAAEMDLTMMLGLAGAERTEKQWHALVDAAGLKIKQVYTYNEDIGASVLVLEKK